MAAFTAPAAIEETIANELGYLTEDQVLKLGKLKPSTTQAWAKRRSGPHYVIFGNSRLYRAGRFSSSLKSESGKPG